jgi:hypothetical protein
MTETDRFVAMVLGGAACFAAVILLLIGWFNR